MRPQGFGRLNVDPIIVRDHDAIVVMCSLFGDIALENVGQNALRVALQRIAPAATAGGLRADYRLLGHLKTIDAGLLPLRIFRRLDPIGPAASKFAAPEAPWRVGIAPMRWQAPAAFFQRPHLQAQA